MYEIGAYARAGEKKEMSHFLSPFKLVIAGSSISVEYVGKRNDMDCPISVLFNARELHNSYRAHIYALDSEWTKKEQDHLSFFGDDSLDTFPKLACTIGTQTAARKANISQQRAEILSLSNAAQLRNAKPLTSSADDLSDAISFVESRKQNLLDRIKAKQLASKANSKPSPQQILRKHALGRIEGVVEILRMMQQRQKVENKSRIPDSSSVETVPGTGVGKVSFSLAELRNNIKSSVSVPISDEEVSMCLKMLSEEFDGNWIRMMRSRGTSNAVFVVLEGAGISGKDALRRIRAKEF
jgi:DNA replication factor Cdt1 C-terminal domain